jgi:DNA-binding transcriptional MerR regulator
METPARIPEKLFFRIGEVCDLIKVQPHVLRYWETEFPMLAPEKNRAGQRVYRRRDVEMVMRIRALLYEEKFTIAGAKKKLQEEMHRGGSRGRVETQQQPHAPAPPTVPVQTTQVPLQTQPSLPIQQDLPGVPAGMLDTSATAASAPAASAVPAASAPQPDNDSDPIGLTPQARRAIRMIKRDLEGLLTLLNSDASIKN